jgi:type III secretion protein L
MSLARARVIRVEDTGALTRVKAPPKRRVIPAAVFDARLEAERIVDEARARAALEGARAREEAREVEIARLAASFVALREREASSLADAQDRIVELAVVLAERVIGEALALEPERVVELARAAIAEARGASRIRIDAHPLDVPALRTMLADVAISATVVSDETLGRGSLIVHTDLGRVDARLEPQLARLAAALKEALR